MTNIKVFASFGGWALSCIVGLSSGPFYIDPSRQLASDPSRDLFTLDKRNIDMK